MTDTSKLGFIESLAKDQLISDEQRKIVDHLAAGHTWKEFQEQGGGLIAFQDYDSAVEGRPVELIGSVGFFETLFRRIDLSRDERRLIEHLLLGGTWNSAGQQAQSKGRQFWYVFDVYDGLILRRRKSNAL